MGSHSLTHSGPAPCHMAVAALSHCTPPLAANTRAQVAGPAADQRGLPGGSCCAGQRHSGSHALNHLIACALGTSAPLGRVPWILGVGVIPAELAVNLLTCALAHFSRGGFNWPVPSETEATTACVAFSFSIYPGCKALPRHPYSYRTRGGWHALLASPAFAGTPWLLPSVKLRSLKRPPREAKKCLL